MCTFRILTIYLSENKGICCNNDIICIILYCPNFEINPANFLRWNGWKNGVLPSDRLKEDTFLLVRLPRSDKDTWIRFHCWLSLLVSCLYLKCLTSWLCLSLDQIDILWFPLQVIQLVMFWRKSCQYYWKYATSRYVSLFLHSYCSNHNRYQVKVI